MNDVDAIIFDMGDILVDATAWRKWLYGFLNKKGWITCSYTTLFEVWETEFLAKIHVSAYSYKHGFRLFLESLGLSDVAVKQVYRVNWMQKKRLENQIRLFPEVLETLAELKRRQFLLAVLTDTERSESEVRTVLETRLNIGKFMDVVVTSADIGVSKPDPRAFSYCFSKMGRSKDRCVFVAHDWDELNGAREIGLKTIAFNYVEPVESTFKIDRFSEILTLV